MITSYPFGTLPDGQAVTAYRLWDGEDHIDVLDYGATVCAAVLHPPGAAPVDVVLGYDTPEEYAAGALYLGATIGRHANRIAGGRFVLNGTVYQLEKNCGANHSHGGVAGFHRRMFTPTVQGETLKMTLFSPHGDQGYPGNLWVTVEFSFVGKALTMEFFAQTDRDTVVSLTNHSYFDLSGGIAPMGQLLRLDADFFTENDGETLPTGRLLPVGGTAFDFRQEKPLSQDLLREETQLRLCGGYDHNFVLKNHGERRPVAWLKSPETGISMTMETDLPGVQLYSGNFVTGRGKGGRQYQGRDGVCLEGQYFPNAMEIQGFEKPILRPEKPYRHTIVYAFATA